MPRRQLGWQDNVYAIGNFVGVMQSGRVGLLDD